MTILRSRISKGFTLIELLIVMVIISILAALVLPVLSNGNKTAKNAAAMTAMSAINVAMSGYHAQFGAYPPDDTPSTEGSELLWYYLCRRLGEKEGLKENEVGPFLNPQANCLRSTNGG